MWGLAVSQLPMVGATVLWLVFLEGLLSADNALVLAMMVRHLPKPEQKRALRYGIWGAFAFRFVAVLLANLLLSLWYLKVLGGAYLLYLAAAHVLSRRRRGRRTARRRRFGSGFWWTVASVELADIAFSIDSILAAVALAEEMHGLSKNEKFLIVVTGGILGIITMRFVAGYFILLLDRFKGLEAGAYGLVAWIGLKLIAGGLYEARAIPAPLNEWVFWSGMVGIVTIGFVYKPSEKNKCEGSSRSGRSRKCGGENAGGDGPWPID